MTSRCRYYWNSWSGVTLNHMKLNPAQNIPESGKIPLVFVIIPGNPGCIQFYEKFAEVLSAKTNIPVWGISHTGHVQAGAGIAHPHVLDCSLEKQIEHKRTYLNEEVVPQAERAMLIGHSIGCYMILQIMDQMKDNESFICKGVLLFPTIERMRHSPNGTRLTPLLTNARWLLMFLTSALRVLPKPLVAWLSGYVTKSKESCIRQTLEDHFHTEVVDCSSYMGLNEMYEVNERDDHIIAQHIDKLIFYYGANDKWCPVSYYENVKQKHGHRRGSHIQLCCEGIEHAFVLHHSTEVAHLVAEWIP